MPSSSLKGKREQETGPHVTVDFIRKLPTLDDPYKERETERDRDGGEVQVNK